MKLGCWRSALLLAPTAVAVLGAQSPALQLRGPAATAPHEFTGITSVRELSDGRVLVVDEKDNRILVVDFERGTSTGIGRIGDGPAEYRRVGRLWPLAGDTTLMVDPRTQRRITLVGSRVASSRPRAGGPVESGLIHGASRDGRMLTVLHSMRGGKLTSLRDSMFVIRGRANSRVDTIARVPSEYANYDPSKPPGTVTMGGTFKRVYKASLPATDLAVLFADGWVAIARTNPYRVDWCPAESPCRKGPTVGEKPARITDADKRAYITDKVIHGGWPDSITPAAVQEWPEFLPPFVPKVAYVDASPLVVLSDGRLMIERIPSALGRTYDIFDRTGERVAQLRVAINQFVVGFGRTSIYVVSVDGDGVQRLERRPW